MVIRPSGRSTDYISPSFGHGCLFDCTYCYMKRHKPSGLSVAKNTADILTAIDHHAWFADVEKPNQTDDEYITYDIGCNEDFALHAKYHDWQGIFEFFRDHPRAKASFATKYVNKELLKFDPKGKVRIRFSMIPVPLRQTLEPNTSTITQRMEAIQEFIGAGYDVHINFSPVIVYKDWLEDYLFLFNYLNWTIHEQNHDKVKAEVIFLTHNEGRHMQNVIDGAPGEELLWRPDLQENKISDFGGHNLRYKSDLKGQFIHEWLDLHNKHIPWNKVRYIF